MRWPFQLTDTERARREEARRDLRNVNALVERKDEIRELKQQISELEESLAIEQSKVRVRDAEIAELSAVMARNLKRVQAETDILTPSKER